MAIKEVVSNQGHIVPYSIEYFDGGLPGDGGISVPFPSDSIPKAFIAVNRGEPSLLDMDPAIVGGKVEGTFDTGKLDAGKYWFDVVVTDVTGADPVWTEPVRIDNTKPVTPL